MSLSLATEQRLKRVKLHDLFSQHEVEWTKVAKTAYDFVKSTFPKNAKIRPDDVAKALEPIIEVDEKLRKYLDMKKLTQKYWISDFTDLIIERTWSTISP
jgi:hypothetical protein